jgi:DNA transposition AAA+ family ATPase
MTRQVIVLTKNIHELLDAYNRLESSAPGSPKICLVHGTPGMGKSTGMDLLQRDFGAVNTRATAAWTPRTMLTTILRELGRDDVKGSNQDQLDEITRVLSISGRPLVVDEADYLFERRGLLDLLRDIHDIAEVPLVLVGMERVVRKVNARELVASRVAEQVKFEKLDREDARQYTDELCEVEVTDDLLDHLHQKANGSARRIALGLRQIELYGKDRGGVVNLAQWQASGKQYFLEG